MNILNDKFKMSGTGANFEKFLEAVKILTEGTKIKTLHSNEIEVFSHCPLSLPPDKNGRKLPEPGKEVFFKLPVEAIIEFLDNYKKPSIAQTAKSDFIGNLLNEDIETTGLIFVANNNKYLLSEHALTLLLKNIGIGAGKAKRNSGLIRDMYIAQSLYETNSKLNYIIREYTENGLTNRKIFSVVGKYFGLIPHDVITHTYEAFTTAKVREWSITQEETRLYFEFPDMAQKYKDETVTPGIILSNSDTGDSFKIWLVLRNSNSYVIVKESNLQHMKSYDYYTGVVDICNNFINEVFNVYETLDNYARVNIKSDNEGGVITSLSALIKKTIGRPFPDNRRNQIIENLTAELDTSKEYTLTDLIIMIMRAPYMQESSENGINPQSLYELRCQCGMDIFKVVTGPSYS